MDKRGTSIQYQVSNVYLFNMVYGKWNEFADKLNKGPQAMKEMLFDAWNEVKENLLKNEEIEVLDKDREITKDDFEITMNKTKKGITIFYIIFPDTDSPAASKCVAIALTPQMPRYFTMEYSTALSDLVRMMGEDAVIEMIGKDVYDNRKERKEFIMGEFVLTQEGVKHINLGEIPNGTIANFGYHVHLNVDGKAE